MKKTLYDILGVDALAPIELIGYAYRTSIKKLEAKLNDEDPEAHNQVVLLKEAYRVLSNPQKRAEYDARLRGESVPTPIPTTTTEKPEISYQRVTDPDEASDSGWSLGKTALLVGGIIAITLIWVGFNYYRNANAAKVIAQESTSTAQSAQTQPEQAKLNLLQQQSTQQKEQELLQKEQELKQEKENARQALLRRRDEEHAGLQQQQQKQREEDERQRLADARREREQEARQQAERKRQYQACLNPAIDRYGLDRARQMCANLR